MLPTITKNINIDLGHNFRDLKIDSVEKDPSSSLKKLKSHSTYFIYASFDLKFFRLESGPFSTESKIVTGARHI
jgi:hypothetical protein